MNPLLPPLVLLEVTPFEHFCLRNRSVALIRVDIIAILNINDSIGKFMRIFVTVDLHTLNRFIEG